MRTLYAIFVATIVSIGIPVLGFGAESVKSVPPPEPVSTDMLVGAYYFPGWCQADRWYCIAANNKVKHPLLGYYREGDPNAADWHIKWALDHGVNFFAFDYYTQDGGQMLESALDEGFLRAQYIDKFKFCLNWCNHGPYTSMTANEMDQFANIVIKKYLTHPSYLRIDDKPVVIFLAGYSFVKNLGVDGAKAEFQKFRDKCVQAGLKGAYIVFCEGEINVPNAIEQSKEVGADAFCLYNYPYAGADIAGPGKYAELSYEHLMKQGEQLWNHWRNITEGSFWPTVMPGWDRRPWLKDKDLIRTGSSPKLFQQFLMNARNYVNKDQVVMIEAWNEWGEGSVLEPSVEDGFGYLDSVRRAFAPNAGDHIDIDPGSAGMEMPVFDIKLPRIWDWRFDYDSGGWKSVNTSPIVYEWGTITAKSVSDDPGFYSPLTYLECADFDSLRIRMRLSKHGDGSDKAQIFWSTVDHGMDEDSSIKFDVYTDDQWHEYTINLASNPNWKGTTDQLRIDPVASPDVDIRIDRITLVSE